MKKKFWFNIYKLIRFIFPIGIRVSTSWECSLCVSTSSVCMCVCVNRVTCVLYNPNHLFKCPSSVPPWVFDAEPFEFFWSFRSSWVRERNRPRTAATTWKLKISFDRSIWRWMLRIRIYVLAAIGKFNIYWRTNNSSNDLCLFSPWNFHFDLWISLQFFSFFPLSAICLHGVLFSHQLLNSSSSVPTIKKASRSL